MKQVLLSVQGGRPVPPVTMWVPDDFVLGDTLVWRRRPWKIAAIYTTRLSQCGTECSRTERPRKHAQAGVVLDHHDAMH